MNKKNFNLIEVTLSMGIAILALSLLTAMLPLGMKNSSDSISIDLSSNLLNGFTDVLIATSDYSTLSAWTEPTYSSDPSINDYIDPTKDLTAQAATAYFNSTAFGSSIFVNSNSSIDHQDQTFFLTTPIYDKNGSESKFRDIEAEVRVWSTTPKVFSSSGKTGSQLGFSSRSTGRGGSRLDTSSSNLKTLVVEASWPISETYDKRAKLRIIRDITNQ